MLFSTPSHFLVLSLLAVGFWLIGFATHSGGRKWREMYEQEADDFSHYRADSDRELRAATRRVTELEREQAESATTIASLTASLEQDRTQSTAKIADLEDRLPAARAPAAVPTVPFAPTPFTPTIVPPDPVDEPAAPVEQAWRLIGDRPPETRAIAPPAAETAAAAPLAISVPTSTPGLASVTANDKKAWFSAAGYNDLTQMRGIDGVLSTRLFGLGVTRFADLEKLSAVDEMALEQRLNVPVGFIAREQWREQAALLRAGNVAEHSHRFGAPVNV